MAYVCDGCFRQRADKVEEEIITELKSALQDRDLTRDDVRQWLWENRHHWPDDLVSVERVLDSVFGSNIAFVDAEAIFDGDLDGLTDEDQPDDDWQDVGF